MGGAVTIANGSCNGGASCFFLAGFNGSGTVGNNSCNGPDVDPEQYYGDGKAPPCSTQNPSETVTYGDCVENTVAVPACGMDIVLTYGDPAPEIPVPGCSAGYTPTTPVSASPLKIRCENGVKLGTLTILPARLTVTPAAQTWDLSGPEPPYTYRIEGWKNGETPATATGFVAPACGPRTAPATAGLYTIVCRGASAANYTVVNEGAILTATGSLPPAPEPPPPPPVLPPLPGWQSYLKTYSGSLGLRYDGDCTGVTVADAGATCHKAAPEANGMNACLYQVQVDGTLSAGCVTFEFRGSGQEWLLVSQTGSFTAAPEPPATPVRPAPAPPNTGTGTGGESAGWLLLMGALALAAGGAAVWSVGRR